MSSPSSSIMTVKEMIDIAFGEPDKNVVDHKMIETILYLLARQLRILERRVEIELFSEAELHNSSLSVSEIKLHATIPKRKRFLKKVVAGGQKGTASSIKAGMTKKATSDIHGATGKVPGGGKTEDKKLLGKPMTGKGMISGDILSPHTASTEKSSTDYKRSIGKSSDKTITEETSTATSRVKTSSDKTTTNKIPADKTSITKSSTDKTSRTTSSIDRTSTAKTSTEKTFTDKSSSQKTSTEKSSSSAKENMSDKSTKQKSWDKTAIAKSTTSSLAKDYHKLLEEIEERREKELRVIHQRADSHEVRETSPTPMASMESIEVRYEKLLVVERKTNEEKGKQPGRLHDEAHHRTPHISVVTQEDFMKLAMAVRDLQTRFDVTAMPDFPENIQLMQELRKGASLTDAMAALQLAARLEAAEKTLGRMMALVTELASTTHGIHSNQMTGKDLETNVIFDGPGTKSLLAQKRRNMPYKKQIDNSKFTDGPVEASFEQNLVDVLSEGVESFPSPHAGTVNHEDNNFITSDELNSALEEIYDDLVKTVTEITNRNTNNAEHALKIANKLEGRLDTTLDLGNRMNNLETLISEYAEQINILDTGLSSQMTNYQEQITQMQHDLEGGLEAMTEALSSVGGDTAAVAELNKHFTNLQSDFETTQMRQKDLKDIQTSLSMDLQSLSQQIEILRDTKSDRAEVADALHDKAGLEALNGLVSLQQFNAVRGDLEKRIGAAYVKFNSQELVWQKIIDDIFRELSNKADLDQVNVLRDSIHSNIEKLRCKIQGMLDIVGEPKAAAISRRLHRESACLSCSSPAHMALEETVVPILPAFPVTRPPTLGAEDTSKSKGDGDHGVCYTGLPIPHSIDPRAHVCHRYCGGSHTTLNNVISRVPPGMIINPVVREFTTEIGTDGKAYRTDEIVEKMPCVPCNQGKKGPSPDIPEETKVPSGHDADSVMTPSDFRHISIADGLPHTQEETPISLLPHDEEL